MAKQSTMEYHSSKPVHQEQLRQLEKLAGAKLDDILTHFGIKDELRKASRFYVGGCPVHGGNNKSAFNVYHTGNETIGNWRCFTHSCHVHFQPTIIGLVRGILSHIKYGWKDKSDRDKECPFKETLAFLGKFCGTENIGDIEIDFDALEMRKFSNHMKHIYAREEVVNVLEIPRDIAIKSLQIPDRYFVSRGYTEAVLKKYDVGLCTAKDKEMYMRAVAPIYNNDHSLMVGCTGRMIFEKCPLCNSHHNPIHTCPQDYEKWKFTKWRHNTGFKGEYYLYNYWFAKEHIRKNGYAIIVESPGNVWRLEEAGIHNSIATFGAHLTDGQRDILDKSGALSLIVLTDPDDAGILATEAIRKSCCNTYSLYFPSISGGDIGDIEVRSVQEQLLPIIDKVKRNLDL